MSRPDATGSAENVLVLAPDWQSGIPVCLPAISAGTRVLVVSYSRPAESYVEFFQARLGTVPETVGIEATGTPRSKAPAEADVRFHAPEKFSLIGVESTDVLVEWTADDAPIVVYFDSITALLQYTDVDTAFRFLHPFTTQVKQTGATGFYRIAPDAHDESTISTFHQLFDTVIEDPD